MAARSIAAKRNRRAYHKGWREKNRRKERGYWLQRKYDITLEQYERQFTAQGGVCALCERPAARSRYGRLNVDHCHDTNRVRGLLCTTCNFALGHLGDNEAGLLKALDYVNGETPWAA